MSISIGGMTPFSTIDYPGMVSAVLYTQGCPLRCYYCHNPHLQSFDEDPTLRWSDMIQFLRRRQGMLQAVVFSGGEPLGQLGLKDAVQEVRELGYCIGLHTSGVYPIALREVLPYIDWVGLDIKAPLWDYYRVTGRDIGVKIDESLDEILYRETAYTIRTTHDSSIDLFALREYLDSKGVIDHVLQEMR